MNVFLSFIFVCFLAWTATAQTADVANLLNIQNRNRPQPTVYSGQPFVYIDKTVEEPVKKTAPEMPEPLSLQHPDFNITTPFGHKTTAAFIDHTTDFDIIVQVIDADTLLVEERIQFVTTKPTTFERHIPLTLTNIKNARPLNVTVIDVKRGNTSIQPDISRNETALTLSDKTPVQAGVHAYLVRYMVKHALMEQDGSTRLVFSLTGTGWPYPTERFGALVLFPAQTSVFEKNVVFGTNNVAIVDTFTAQTDDKGNTSFRLKRPLPAGADVKIMVFFDGTQLPQPLEADFIQRFPDWFVFTLILGAQIFYIVLSAFLFKMKKKERKPLKFLTSWPLNVLRFATRRPISTDWLNKMALYAKETKRFQRSTGVLQTLVKYRLTRPIARLIAPIYIGFKYLTTQIVLIAIFGFLAADNAILLSGGQYGLLISGAVLMTVWIVSKGALPHVRRNIAAAESVLLTDDFGLGLSKKASKTLFLQYYPYLLATGKENIWRQNQKQYNNDIAEMTFDKEEK